MAEDDASLFHVIQLSVVLGSLCTAAVGTRLVAQWKSKANFGLDDGFMIASLLPFYTLVACSVLRMYNGARKDDTRF
jgi:hypothetical protein